MKIWSKFSALHAHALPVIIILTLQQLSKHYLKNYRSCWDTALLYLCICVQGHISKYGKYPKNSNTKASDKMTYANSVDPDQTAPEGAVWSRSTLFAIPLNI